MFTIEVFQNPFLPAGTGRVDAILTVSSGADSRPSLATDSIEGFILDVSGSMSGQNIERMKCAAQTAVLMLSGQVHFFIVAFSDNAQVVVPLMEANAANKAAAETAIQQLEAGGGTRISDGLAKARSEFNKLPGARGHALFLTDGKNSPDDIEKLMAELLSCQNLFQADCRGVGTDWEPVMLREIADQLMGTAKIIPESSGLEADFQDTLQKALVKNVGNARVRIVTPKSGKAKLAFMKQMSPAILDLTHRAVMADNHTLDFPTGSWGSSESRDFHIAFDVPPGLVGDEMLVCRTSMLYGPASTETANGGPILAAWTPRGDERSALINPHVAHFTGQSQLAQNIQEGLAARARGDIDAATQHLTRAVKLAQESGNALATQKLREVVVQNPDGTVLLRKNVEKAKVMDLDLSSIVTSRAVPKASEANSKCSCVPKAVNQPTPIIAPSAERRLVARCCQWLERRSVPQPVPMAVPAPALIAVPNAFRRKRYFAKFAVMIFARAFRTMLLCHFTRYRPSLMFRP